MRTECSKQDRCLYLLALLWAIFLFVAHAAEGSVPFPPVPEAPELSWDRQTFFRDLPEWRMESPEFPWIPSEASMREAESDAAAPAATLFREARERERAGGRPGDLARLYLRAYAAGKNREVGYVALKQAARLFYRAGNYMEASGVLTRLIDRSGPGSAGVSFNLLKGEALARQGNLLTARECFRRASAAKWNADIQRRISLRIADMSFLIGNIAFAEPQYRRALSAMDAPRRFPYESIRYGETLLAAGKIEEALAVFRNVQGGALPPELRAAARLGEGDALLIRKDFADARFAYEQAGLIGNSPIRSWAQLRNADIEFAAGSRGKSSVMYRDLKQCAVPDVAREAWYKFVLTRYLMSDHETVLAESQGYLGKYPGKPDETPLRKMAARAGASLVQEVGRKRPGERWPALTNYLFAYGRAPEGKTLYAAVGGEWEAALLWGGASALYAAAGETARSRDMLRIEGAEQLYWKGDLAGAAAALGIRDPAAESSRGALRLLARIHFREGKYDEAAILLRRIEALSGEPEDGKGTGLPLEKEFLAFTRALQGKWPESLEALEGIDPTAAPPPVRGLRALAAGHAAAGEKASAAAPGTAPPAGPGDLYSVYERTQARYRRLTSEGAD